MPSFTKGWHPQTIYHVVFGLQVTTSNASRFREQSCAVHCANLTSAVGDLPLTPSNKPSSPSASLTNMKPWLNCASASPLAALCFTTSAPSAPTSSEGQGQADIARHVIHPL